jgi:hypothetical protein
MRGDAEDAYAAGGVLDDEERVQPTKGDRVQVEQVAREDRVRLGSQKLGPGWSARRGAGSTPAAWRIIRTVEAPIW